MTRLWSQGKSVAHAGLDSRLLNLLSKWVSLVQMEFSCLASCQGGCLFLQAPLFNLIWAGDTEAQRAVFHTCLPTGLGSGLCLLTRGVRHAFGLCGVGQEPGHP